MISTLKRFSLIVFALLIVSSCTVEKRLYNKGYHVEWRKKNKSLGGNKTQHEEAASIRSNHSTQVETQRSKNTSVQMALESENPSVSFSEDKLLSNPEKANEEKEPSINTSDSEALGLSESAQRKAPEALRVKTKMSQQSEGSGGKSQVIALILVLLIGVLGIHRFYLGYTGIGILMILTAGCCGVLVVIDLVRIILGDLKPKGGEYDETL